MTSPRTASVSGAMVWFAVSYVGAVLGFLGVNAVAGRWLGPDDFGFMVAALTAAGLLGQVGLLGSHRSGLREVAQLRGREDPEAMAVLRNGVRAVSLTSLPLAGLVAGGLVWLLLPDATTSAKALFAVILMTLVVLMGQQQLWANYARGLGHVRFAALLEGRSGGSLVAGAQALVVLAVWRLAPGTGLAGALAAIAAGFVLPVLAARTVVRRHWTGLDHPRPRLLRDLRYVAARDWRFLSGQVATFLNTSAEIWIAVLLLSAVDTSMYSAGQRLALLLLLPLTALQVVLAPVVARARPTGKEGVATGVTQRLVRTATTVATALCLCLMLPYLVVPELVLDLVIGPGFRDAVPVLLLLSIGYLGNVATGMAGTALSMWGREGVAAQVQWTGAGLRVLLGVPAALTFGLLGLTCSALAVSVTVFTLMWWRARRTLGMSTHLTLRPEISLLRRTPG